MGSSDMRAARQSQLEHPGTTSPEGKRAVVALPTAGSTPPPPRIRFQGFVASVTTTSPRAVSSAGTKTLVLSGGDLRVDPRRVSCAATTTNARRAIEVIMMTDDT